MTDESSDFTSHQPSGTLLSQREVEFLHGELPPEEAEEVRETLRSDLWDVLHELELLWYTLPDKDLEAVFNDCSDDEQRHIRSPIQQCISLLYHAATLTGDDVHFRFREAIQAAEAAKGQWADVDFEVRTSEMLSPQETLNRLEEEGMRTISMAELEQLWRSDDIPADELAKVYAGITEKDKSEIIAEIRRERQADGPDIRPPTTTVLNISRSEEEADNGGQ